MSSVVDLLMWGADDASIRRFRMAKRITMPPHVDVSDKYT